MIPITKKSVVEEMTKEAQTVIETEIRYEDMFKMYVGAEFPLKSAPTPDALWSVNILKKTIIEFIRVQSYISILFFVNRKSIQKLLDSFNRIGYGVMNPYIRYKHFNLDIPCNLTPTARGIEIFVTAFLKDYGIIEETAIGIGELLAHIIELDSFYRFKLLDLLHEMKWDNNPRKEVQRLLQLCYTREEIIPTYMRPKLKMLKWGAWLLSLPSLKKAWKYAVEHTDLNLLKMDEADYYWMCIREDYNYFGKTKEERAQIIKDKGWKVITPTNI